MDHSENIRKKIRKELKYYRIQNIRLMQEIEQLEEVVQHNSGRLSRIEGDRQKSDEIVNLLRKETQGDGH